MLTQFNKGEEDPTLFCKGEAAVDDHLISAISWFHDILTSDGDPSTSGGESFTPVEEWPVSLHEALAIAEKGDTIARSNTKGRKTFERPTDERVAYAFR